MSSKSLQPIYQGLSIWERVLLVLRNWQDGQPNDPDFQIGIQPEEVGEFNRYIGLMNQAHDLLGLFAVGLEGAVRSLVLRYCSLLTLNLWEMELWSLAVEVARVVEESKSADKKLVRDLRKVFLRHLEVGGPRTVEKSHEAQNRMQLAEAQLAALKREFGYVSSQLLAAERVISELSDEFRGEDPLHPLVKHVLDKAREDLNDLGVGLKRYGRGLPQPEPHDDLLEALREGIWRKVDSSHPPSVAPARQQGRDRMPPTGGATVITVNIPDE